MGAVPARQLAGLFGAEPKVNRPTGERTERLVEEKRLDRAPLGQRPDPSLHCGDFANPTHGNRPDRAVHGWPVRELAQRGALLKITQAPSRDAFRGGCLDLELQPGQGPRIAPLQPRVRPTKLLKNLAQVIALVSFANLSLAGSPWSTKGGRAVTGTGRFLEPRRQARHTGMCGGRCLPGGV